MVKILAIVGPTASGKSAIALELAEKHGAEILSCDSLVLYRGLDIGTAKPTREELARVRHHGVDLAAIDEPFNAADYARYAAPVLESLVKAGKPVLIVGGTGFYLKALVCGTWDAPPTNLTIRVRLEKLDSVELHAKLAAADPEHATKIQANDRYRVIRALEIIEVSGSSVTELLKNRELQNTLPYPVKILGITRDKDDLEKRIVARTNAMLAAGLVDETQELLKTFAQTSRPLGSVGYNEVLQHLRGEMTFPECRERIIVSTRQLAKKQMTFFKTFPNPIEWFHLPSEQDRLMRAAEETLAP